jgi:two-component system alkaline phosphatase synthesis response regulator PhoP
MQAKIRKILIADDEPDILEIVSFNLRGEGYEVFTAKNGDEAIEEAKKNHPDLIILDVMMPGKNGFEVCNILRLQPDFKDTLIIFLTALNDETTEIKGLETGGDDYITKPISPKILISRVNALFRRASKDEIGVIQIGDLQIDREKYNVIYKNEQVILARKEF